MKKVLKLLLAMLLMCCLVVTFSGCEEDDDDEVTNRKKKNTNDNNIVNEVDVTDNNEVINKTTDDNKEVSSKPVVKDGLYNMVLREDDVELSAGDVCLRIEGNKITVGDGFSGVAEEGTFEINGSSLVGTYTKIRYIDHQKGGDITEEDISEEFNFDILENGSLRDNYGYESKFGHKNFSGRIYRLVEE